MQIFLDTNILIDWLFLKDKDAEQIKPLSKNLKATINLYNQLRLVKKDHNFAVSFYGLAESQDVIIRQIVNKKLVNDSISLTYYSYYERDFRDKERKYIEETVIDLIEIMKEFKTYSHYLNVDGKLLKKVFDVQNKYKLRIMDTLIIMCVDETKFDYFVTRDRDFLDNKQLKKDFRVKIVSPKEMINELKKVKKK